MRTFSIAFGAAVLAARSAVTQSSGRKQQASELRDSYDFIVAGGGTAGLTVADRLSEHLPSKSILVIEHGDTEFAPGIFDPPMTVWGASERASSFSFTSVPNPEVNGALATTIGGKVVGGSSAVNGMFFDRPSRFDWDAYHALGSPEFDEADEKWDWDGVFPFHRKSVTFTEPTDERYDNMTYTWNMTAYGGSTPIYSTFPPFLWGDHMLAREAWEEMGIHVREECAGGDKDGLCWIPISEHPVTSLRSHSGVGHWAAVNESRDNYDLLVKHQVVRLVFPDGIESSGAFLVEVQPANGGDAFNVTVNAEVVISSGTFNTPAILQRSGIGPVNFLEESGIPVLVDLPGVGSNLQDHSGAKYYWDYESPGDWSPMPQDLLTTAGFISEAQRQFEETPARGPYTLALSNSAIFMPLPNMTTNYMDIIDKMRAMVDDDTAATFLPESYRSDPRMVAGYKSQLSVMADLHANPKAPSLESTFATGKSMSTINLHPLSRGTVRVDADDPLGMPVIDYRAGSNPVDFDLNIAHVRYLRRLAGTDAMQRHGAVEAPPLAGVGDDDEALLEYVKETFVFSFMHACCTAAMMPEGKGGVVGPDLKVHGLRNVRVADNSILPFEPSSHLSSTAYAIGEKAAQIIIESWSEQE